MADIENSNHNIIPLSQAVETIKTAILQGQYEANKGVNRIQLAVYFAIGKYLSKNTRNLEYGAGAIKAPTIVRHNGLIWQKRIVRSNERITSLTKSNRYIS